jgi:hypothetical protein
VVKSSTWVARGWLALVRARIAWRKYLASQASPSLLLARNARWLAENLQEAGGQDLFLSRLQHVGAQDEAGG